MAQPVRKKKEQKYTAPAAGKQAVKRAGAGSDKYFTALVAIVVISFIAYLPALQNHFLWDDEQYVQKNLMIHSINLKKLFSTYVMGNYHPVTMLAYAIQYQLFGLSEKGYHLFNVLFHVANTVLVFYVVFKLSGKVPVALVASLLFGIHPLHVESVAWASGLKDLLYTFFFLSAYLCYLKYLQDKSRKLYLFCLLLFLLSLLSKAMAASFPVILLLTDYFRKRRMDAKVWLEKAPFLVLSVIFGVVAVLAQQSAEAIREEALFPLGQRMVFACYGFITYIVKLIMPLKLNAYYQYPIDSGAALPPSWYAYVIVVLALAGCVFYSLRYSRKLFWGIGFFAITVFLVLQLLPVGGTIMADRYSYIPSIGIFYLAGEGFYWLWNKKLSSMNLRIPAVSFLVLFSLFFTVRTYSRCADWKDAKTLWNDVIRQSPDLAIGYYNRAIIYKEEGNLDAAFNDFNMTIKCQPEHVKAYNNRAIIFAMRKQYDEAIKDFSKVIELDPANREVYANRGICFQNVKRLDEALHDYNKAIEQQPNSPQAFYNRAVIEYNSGQKEKACADYRQSMNLGFPPAVEAVNKLCH